MAAISPIPSYLPPFLIVGARVDLGARPQNREGRIFIAGFSLHSRRVERHTGLARVDIEVQNQEFRSQGAKIDLAIDNRIGKIFSPMKSGRQAAAGYAGRRKIHIDTSADKGLEGLKTDDANLRYAGAQTPRNLESCPVQFPDLKTSLEFVNGGKAAFFRERGAFRLIRIYADVKTAIRHAIDGKLA
jgi:hypothetical protein